MCIASNQLTSNCWIFAEGVHLGMWILIWRRPCFLEPAKVSPENAVDDRAQDSNGADYDEDHEVPLRGCVQGASVKVDDDRRRRWPCRI